LKSSSIRDLKLSRQEEVDYLAKNGVLLGKAQYSINKGYGELVLAEKTLTSNQALPSEATLLN
jgi:argininosuccinate synthase